MVAYAFYFLRHLINVILHQVVAWAKRSGAPRAKKASYVEKADMAEKGEKAGKEKKADKVEMAERLDNALKMST